jgi:hypothetical protein
MLMLSFHVRVAMKIAVFEVYRLCTLNALL